MPTIRTTYSELWRISAATLLAAAIATTLHYLTSAPPVQRQGNSLMEVLFGDARQQLSTMLYNKVEEYYHGGVKCEACSHNHDSEDTADTHDHQHDHHHHHDLWSYLNRQIHVQEHRHLKHNEMVELLPWLWAACRTSSDNLQAFTSGAYILNRMLNRSDQAVELLQQGISQNPNSPELELALAELYLNHLNNKTSAVDHLHAAYSKLPPLTSDTSDPDRRLRLEVLFYLAHLAHSQHNYQQLHDYTREAEKTLPNHVSTQTMQQWLKEAQAQ